MMSSTARSVHVRSLSPSAIPDEIKQIKQRLGLRRGEWAFILGQHTYKPTWQLLGYLRDLQEQRLHIHGESA